MILKKNQQATKKHEKLPSRQKVKYTLMCLDFMYWNTDLFIFPVSDPGIRQQLHENFQLTPALANVVKCNGTATSSDTITAEVSTGF